MSQCLLETGLSPTSLQLELTESTLIEGGDTSVEALHQLHASGVQIYLDDFGTGYSSVLYLRRFSVTGLKIDGTFLDEITGAGGEAPIAAALISFARGLNLKVIFEGVETTEQLAFLRRNRCDEVQGYLISPPLEPEAFAEFVKQRPQSLHLEASKHGPSRAKEACNEMREDQNLVA